MSAIQIDHSPDRVKLDKLGVFDWPIWTKKVSEFPWTYDEQEICYFLEGEVEVVPECGEPVHIQKGDLVIFPVGLSCVWKVKHDVRKHYRFG